jgi:hypothetical protein
MRERWRVSWSHAGIWSLRQLPWRDAARVDAAVERLANRNEGEIVRLDRDDAVTLRLHVPPYFVRLTLDPIDGVLCVWAVYRLR